MTVPVAPAPEPVATATPERILAGARACFSRYGLRKTSMADIARAAGCSRGSVYRHFPDKAAVWRAVTAQQTARFLDEVRRATAGVAGLVAQIEEVLRLTGEFARDDPLNAAMTRSDPEARARALTTEGGPLLAMAVDVVAPLVAAARDAGEARADVDPRRAAEWVTRAVFSLLTTPAATFDGTDPDAVRAFLRDFLVAGLD